MVAGIAAGAVAWAPQPGRCGLGAAAWALRRRRAAHCRVQYYPSERSAVDTVQPGDFARTRCGRSRWMPILPRHTPPYVKRWQRSDPPRPRRRRPSRPRGGPSRPAQPSTLVKRCELGGVCRVSEAVVLARKKLKLEGQRTRRATQESWREIKKRREAEKEELALDSGDPKVAIPAVLAALCNQVVARNLKLKRREAMLRNLKLARNLKLKRREAKVAVAAGGGEGARGRRGREARVRAVY
jgi:hypothetical protein